MKLSSIIDNDEKIVLEKSHPSLWLMEYLLEQFPNSRFVCVYRDLEPTVSSMLMHNGIIEWYNLLPLNQTNRFLGITEENKFNFKNLSIEEKCALRWKSHYKEIFRLRNLYPNKLFLVKYDDFLINPNPILSNISNFLEISDNFMPEDFKIESLEKWKTFLTIQQVEVINNIVKK